MPNFGAFQFAPSDAGDWAKYAGFNRSTGQMNWMDESPAPQAGVAPPQSMAEYFESKIAPVQSKLQAIAPAAAQLGQGNIMQAKNILTGGVQQQTPATQPTQVAPANPYDYTFGLE